MREFDTGATRDTDEGKLAYEGFLSPRVLERYAKYMHTHRVQADGKLRAADNWQKGIPVKAYMDSLVRHIMDLWLAWREDDRLDDDLLCAVLFNAMGLLFESTGAPIDVQLEDYGTVTISPPALQHGTVPGPFVHRIPDGLPPHGHEERQGHGEHINNYRHGPADRRSYKPWGGNAASPHLRRDNGPTSPHPDGRRSTDHAHP